MAFPLPTDLPTTLYEVIKLRRFCGQLVKSIKEDVCPRFHPKQENTDDMDYTKRELWQQLAEPIESLVDKCLETGVVRSDPHDAVTIMNEVKSKLNQFVKLLAEGEDVKDNMGATDIEKRVLGSFQQFVSRWRLPPTIDLGNLSFPAGKDRSLPRNDALDCLKAAQAKLSGYANPIPDKTDEKDLFGRVVSQLSSYCTQASVFSQRLALYYAMNALIDILLQCHLLLPLNEDRGKMLTLEDMLEKLAKYHDIEITDNDERRPVRDNYMR